MTNIDIEKLATLARIEMSDEEKKSLEKDVESILGYVEQVQDIVVDTDTEPETGSLYNVMREDGGAHKRGKYTKELLDEVPSRVSKDGKDYINVKDIL